MRLSEDRGSDEEGHGVMRADESGLGQANTNDTLDQRKISNWTPLPINHGYASR